MRWKRSRKKRVLTMQSLQHAHIDVRVAVLLRSGGVCAYCGRALTLATLTLDHVQPVQRGGPPTLDNLVACCPACNLAKGTGSRDAFPRVPGRPG